MSRIRLFRRLGVWVAAALAIAVVAPAAAGAKTPSAPATAAWAHSRTYGATSLTLDPGAAAALKSLGVTPGVVAPAKVNRNGSLSFPITDPLSRALATGVITHSGGISLTAGSTTVDLTNFDINLFGRSLSADVGGARVTILGLDYSGARLGFRYGRVTFGPVTASLTQTAADALNSAFHVTAFTKGLVLGKATIVYRLYPLF